MSSLDVTVAAGLLDHLTGTATYTPDPPFELALLTAMGDASTPGTEVTGGSYARQTIAFDAATDEDGEVSTVNSSDVDFAGMPACTVVGGEVYDDAGARLAWGVFSAAREFASGDPAKVEAGTLALVIP